MGIKFASIHIIGNINIDINQVLQTHINNEYFKWINHILDENTFYYILKTDYAISIYCEDFSFESINDEAINILGEKHLEFITIGFYEDDLLDITYFNEDTIKSRIVVGTGIKDYGFESTIIEIDDFIKRFKIDEEKLFLCYSNDLYQMCKNISNLISLPLYKTNYDIKKDKDAHVIRLD